MSIFNTIKNNISIFTLTSFGLFVSVCIGIFTLKKNNPWLGTIVGIYIVFLIAALLFLVADRVMKKNIVSKLKLNSIQLLILLIISSLFLNK